jgi:uncharacterized phage protein (TIGR01671 family)
MNNPKIKFRVWDIPHKKMILVWNLEWHSNQNTYWISGSSVDGWQNSGFVNVNFSPLMQYVGRQDKNGKNVFCGDYVKPCTNMMVPTTMTMKFKER